MCERSQLAGVAKKIDGACRHAGGQNLQVINLLKINTQQTVCKMKGPCPLLAAHFKVDPFVVLLAAKGATRHPIGPGNLLMSLTCPLRSVGLSWCLILISAVLITAY